MSAQREITDSIHRRSFIGGRYASKRNWRITFGWDSEDAVDVDLEDYH